MRIAVFGATGYTGGHLTEEALRRGHTVTAVSRSAPPDARPGLVVRAGSLFDEELLEAVAAEADLLAVAVPAVSASGSLADAVPTLLATSARHGARVGVVGGAGSLLTGPDGPALYDTPDFPDAFREGSRAQGAVLATLRSTPSEASWFYLSPAGRYGKHSPGERTGTFRLGEDILLTDADGVSFVSGADYAIAFLDEVERPAHVQRRFTVGY